MANRVFRGPVDRAQGHPFLAEGEAVDAFLPGNVVSQTSAGLAIATAATAPAAAKFQLLVAKEQGEHYPDGGINDAYAAGDSAVAVKLQAGDYFTGRVATGQALVSGVTYLKSNGDGQFSIADIATETAIAKAHATVTTSADQELVLLEAV